MRWNWQRDDWPKFAWREGRLAKAEARFLLGAGRFTGMVRHLTGEDRERLIVEAMSGEAVTTSEIEGEILNRESVQSSIRRQLGLAGDARRVPPAEEGVSEMMVDLFRRFAEPLDHSTLFGWHEMLLKGRRDLRDVGRYRTHDEAMQIVSGSVYEPKVHFEAPPSRRVANEMGRYIAWYNRTAPGGRSVLPVLTRAGIAHLYFECIHPFEDGNGRLGRAIAEKVIAQSLGEQSLTAIATTILAHRADYYRALEAANKRNEITEWLAWFAGIAIEAQERTLAHVEFVIGKTKLLDRFRDRLNARQTAAMLRMLREGAEGFNGGMSAGKYAAITKASAATAGRDLVEMVEIGALERTGEKKGTRYHLPIPMRRVARVRVTEDGEVAEVRGK